MKIRNRSTETPSETFSFNFDRATGALALLGIFLLALAACQTPRMASAGEESVTVKGRVSVKDRPSGRVTLFFAAQKPGGRSKEVATNTKGEFSGAFPPGIYRIRASPTTACPIRNTLVIPPFQKADVSILLKTTPLSFIHCMPSHIALLSSPGSEETVAKPRPSYDIAGFWVPAPQVPATLFLDADPSNGTLRQIAVDARGHFPITSISPGPYKLVATVAGFCPVSVHFSVSPSTRYLVIRVPRFHPGSPCPGSKATLHDRAFALSEGE